MRLATIRTAQLGLAAAIVAVWTSLAHADATDERFLEGLRGRRLFSLAQSYCLEKLGDSSLPEERRAELTVELSRSYTEHALHSTPPAADPLWKQAVEVTYDFARRSPESPRNVLVKTQGALVLLARGEQARQQSEVLANNEKQLDEARGYLRLATRQLNEAADEVAARLRQTGRAKPNDLARDELLSLERNIRYHLARTYRNQGQSYPPNSPDRANSLTQAVEALGPLAQLSQADPLSWQCKLEEIVCYRLLKDTAAGLRRLESLFALEPPPLVALRGRAEHIRLALASGRTEAALALTESGRSIDGLKHPDLDLAIVEALVAGWRAAGEDMNAAAAKQRQSQASAMIGEIERLHGAYWSRRAESLMAGQVATSTVPPGDLDVLVRAAESHYRGGNFDAAVEAYDRAQEYAATHEQPERAFELAYAAGSVEHERKAHRAAAVRFRSLALGSPKHPRAGDAHLMAIFNVAQEARREASPQLDEYAGLLEEHLKLWPSGKSAEQANWLLGRLKEHEGDWAAAIAAYEQVSVDHAQFAEAVEGIAGCYRRWLDQLEAADQPTSDLAKRAARYFEGLFVADEGRLPERWSPTQRIAAVEAARIWLETSPPDYARAEQILSAALASADEADAAWKATAAGLLVSALAGQSRHAEARERMQAAAGSSPAELLSMLERLSEIAAAAKPELRKELAALELEALSLVERRRQDLDEAGRLNIDRMQARALAAAGNRDDALRRYAELARQQPRDGEIQEEYATLLSAGTDRPSLESALVKWRELEQRSRPASERWFRAKYHLALTHERLGNSQQAAKIITLTQVLHPELGGAAMKAKFLELLARCK